MDRRTRRTLGCGCGRSQRRHGAPDVETLRSVCLKDRVRTAPWINRKITKKPEVSKNDCLKSLAKLAHDAIPVSKFDNDQVNHTSNPSASSSSGGNRLPGGNRLRGGRHQDGMNRDFSFSPSVNVFRSQTMTILCKRRAHTVSQAHFLTHFFCVAYRHCIHAWFKGVSSAHVTSLHLRISIIMFHPLSLPFFDGHFETTSPTLTSAPSLPNCSRSESQAHFRTSGG